MGKCCTKPEISDEEYLFQSLLTSLNLNSLNGETVYKELIKLSSNSKIQKNSELKISKYRRSNSISSFEDTNISHLNTNHSNTTTNYNNKSYLTYSSDKDNNYNNENYQNENNNNEYSSHYNSLFTNPEQKISFINNLIIKNKENLGNNNTNTNNDNTFDNDDNYEFQFKYIQYLVDQPKEKAVRYLGNFIIENACFSNDKTRLIYLIKHVLDNYGKEDIDVKRYLNDIVEINTTMLLKSFEDKVKFSSYYESSIWSNNNKNKFLSFLYSKFLKYKSGSAIINDTKLTTPQESVKLREYQIPTNYYNKSNVKNRSKSQRTKYKYNKDYNMYECDRIKEPKNSLLSNFGYMLGFTSKSSSKKEKYDDNNKNAFKKQFDEDKESVIKAFLIDNFSEIKGQKIRKTLFEMATSN